MVALPKLGSLGEYSDSIIFFPQHKDSKRVLFDLKVMNHELFLIISLYRIDTLDFLSYFCLKQFKITSTFSKLFKINKILFYAWMHGTWEYRSFQIKEGGLYWVSEIWEEIAHYFGHQFWADKVCNLSKGRQQLIDLSKENYKIMVKYEMKSRFSTNKSKHFELISIETFRTII